MAEIMKMNYSKYERFEGFITFWMLHKLQRCGSNSKQGI